MMSLEGGKIAQQAGAFIEQEGVESLASDLAARCFGMYQNAEAAIDSEDKARGLIAQIDEHQTYVQGIRRKVVEHLEGCRSGSGITISPGAREQ